MFHLLNAVVTQAEQIMPPATQGNTLTYVISTLVGLLGAREVTYWRDRMRKGNTEEIDLAKQLEEINAVQQKTLDVLSGLHTQIQLVNQRLEDSIKRGQ